MLLSRPKAFAALVTLLLAAPATYAEDCGKAFVIENGTCAKLKVGFDLSSCGGASLVAAKISDCGETKATASVKSKGKTYASALTGATWGDSTQWTAGPVVAASTSKKKASAEAATSSSAVSAPVATAPAVVPTPVAPPVAAPVVVSAPKVPASATTPIAAAEPAQAPTPVATAPATVTAAPIALVWNGDLRYRVESIRQDRQTPTNYTQSRIRARFGLTADLGDDTLVNFRLATGAGRVSTNQTLGASNQAFANYGVLLDRASFRWAGVPNLAFIGGRVANPFWAPGGVDEVWDTDLNFDGLVVTGENKGAVTPFATAGLFWINQVTSGDTATTNLASAQLGVKAKLNDDSKLNFAVAFHHYIAIVGRTNPFGASAAASAFSGNTVTGANNNTWVNNYDVLNGGPEFQTKLFGKTASIFFDYVFNAAISSENTGYVAGVKFGELKAPGDYQVTYDYRRVEKDATVDTFTDGDSAQGGTDLYSHRVSVTYKVKKNWQTSLTGYIGEKFVSNAANQVTRNKIHYDLVFSF